MLRAEQIRTTPGRRSKSILPPSFVAGIPQFPASTDKCFTVLNLPVLFFFARVRLCPFFNTSAGLVQVLTNTPNVFPSLELVTAVTAMAPNMPISFPRF